MRFSIEPLCAIYITWMSNFNHNSFLLAAAGAFCLTSAGTFTFSLPSTATAAAVTRSAQSEAMASDISEMTLPHAIAQMLTLMLPNGALGKDNTHSA
jgi:hypothetical protein